MVISEFLIMNGLCGECDSDQWCRTTKGDTFKTTFTWTIEDYISRPEKKGSYFSPSIVHVRGPDNKTYKWQFDLYPRGNEKHPDSASIYMTNMNDFDVLADFEVSVQDTENHLTELVESSSAFSYDAKGEEGDTAWSELEENVDQLKANSPYLTNGRDLILVINIIFYGEEKVMSGSKNINSEDLPLQCKTQVVNDYAKIFAEEQFSDVLLECDGQAFKCHQVILSARSPVFMAMFQAEMKESKTKVVTVKDISKEVLKEMLHFIYTGTLSKSVDDLSVNMTRDLLRAADQYQLDLLKKVCEEKLCLALSVGNALEYLVLADLHQASSLKAKAVTVVVTNMTVVVNSYSEDYKNFLRNHPELAFEVTMTRYKNKKRKAENAEVKERTSGNSVSSL